MSLPKEPLVSVLTPVYNGADFLVDCIESVLSQRYQNYEYIIVNNCSKDGTLEIARRYERKDPRIRVLDNERFVGVIENHNKAFNSMSPESRYCKVVSADDWILPECLRRMVEFAEANPSVAMVGTYMLAGKQVMNTGLEYERRVVKGSEICRDTLLGGPYVFGAPTSLLYRSDLVRRTPAFYPNPNPHSDTTACYQALEHADFGFVHQVLAHARVHAESQTSRSIKYGTIRRALIADLVRFGPIYLTPKAMKKRLGDVTDYYYRWLVGALLMNRGDPEFWNAQKAELREAGIEVTFADVLWATLKSLTKILFRPGVALRKMSKVAKSSGEIEARYYEE